MDFRCALSCSIKKITARVGRVYRVPTQKKSQKRKHLGIARVPDGRVLIILDWPYFARKGRIGSGTGPIMLSFEATRSEHSPFPPPHQWPECTQDSRGPKALRLLLHTAAAGSGAPPFRGRRALSNIPLSPSPGRLGPLPPAHSPPAGY